MNEEYLKARAESLKAPERKIQISDEDLLRKICEYAEQSFLVFKNNYPKPINFNKTKSKVVRKKKLVKPIDFCEEFAINLTKYKHGDECNEIFKYIIDMRGFNGLPKIVSDKEAKAMEKEGNVFFRGADKNEHYANLLAEKSNYHYGGGWKGNGIYATISEDIAKGYAYKNKNGPLKFSIKGEGFSLMDLNALTMCIDNLKEEEIANIFANESKEKQDRIALLYDTYHKLPYKIKKYVSSVVYRDVSLIAAFLGYDYIFYNEECDEPETCILNRGAIVVSESEFKRVTKGTKYERKTGGQFGE